MSDRIAQVGSGGWHARPHVTDVGESADELTLGELAYLLEALTSSLARRFAPRQPRRTRAGGGPRVTISRHHAEPPLPPPGQSG